MASATSPTTGCGCCCTAASAGRLTEPQGCEAAHHAWWRRAAYGTAGENDAARTWQRRLPACPRVRLVLGDYCLVGEPRRRRGGPGRDIGIPASRYLDSILDMSTVSLCLPGQPRRGPRLMQVFAEESVC